MTPALVARQRATEKTVQKFLGQTVEWGVSDCIIIGITHLKNMGHKRPPLANATWHNEKQALRAMYRALKTAGLEGGMADLVTACGFEPISPLETLIGDLIGLPADLPWDIGMGIYTGNRQVLGSVPLADGSWRVVNGSAEIATHAWRLNPCQP